MHAAMRTMHNAAASGPLAGYFARYDATTITGVADATALSSWPDLSANGYTLNHSSNNTFPIYYKTTAAKLINGLPAVWFDSTIQEIETTASITQAQPFTWFVVASVNSTTSPRQLLTHSHPAPEPQVYTTPTHWSTYDGVDVAGGTVDTNPHVICSVFNGASSLTEVDGTTVATGNPGTNGGAGVFAVGGGSAGGGFGEIILYPSALSPTDRASVRSYLKSKWGTP